MLKNKKILIGVTGGISAYKIPLLVSALRKKGALVKVIMTKNATQFINPCTFAVITQDKVGTDMFDHDDSVPHINLADWADMVVIAPATANCIGKIAHGIADDLLTTTVMASTSKKIFVPSMNMYMLENPVLQKNIKNLKEMGYLFVEPATGWLACGYEGKGRLPDIDDLVKYIECWSNYELDFTERRIMVTAGSTREYWDDLRFFRNNSSGKLGYSIAQAASMRGADVTLITAPTELPPPTNVETIKVISAKDMYHEVTSRWENYDIGIMSAAVADYTPSKREKGKFKKTGNAIALTLTPTQDILQELGTRKKQSQRLVGFALESENMIENAREKMHNKNLDMIIANPLKVAGSDHTTCTILTENFEKTIENTEKFEAANIILQAIREICLQ
jgi:phosphopantothenoylcysteine decarboxylase/phosphopantothenate--cysteine ligase